MRACSALSAAAHRQENGGKFLSGFFINVNDAIRQRRAVEQFVAHHVMSEDDQRTLLDASLVPVLSVGLSVLKKPQPIWEKAPEPARAVREPVMDTYYNGQPQVQCEQAICSYGIAAQTIMQAAKSLGYDTCIMYSCDFE